MRINEFFKKIGCKIKDMLSKVKNRDLNFFILALCVCIIATSIIWTNSNKYKKYPDISSIEEEEENSENINETVLMDDYLNKIKEQFEESQLEEDLLEEDETIGPDLHAIAAPLAGVVIKEYSVDKLVYFETLEEWRVHTGIDIKPKDSLIVNSAYDGKVEKINNDTLMGIEVIINNGGGVKTLYSCLTVCKVQEGDEISKGDIIGGIGKCECIEMSDGPHLHFEIIVDGNTVNPLDYFPNEEN